MTLVEFLRARLAEDETKIRANLGTSGLGDDGDFPDYRTYQDKDTDAAEEFLRHFKPPRMLAEVEAKRRLMEGHNGPDIGICQCNADCPCPTLRLLALPYADHPDYRTEWRPDV